MELLKRKDVPKEQTWDLSLIYPDDASMWEALEKVKAQVADLAETYAGKLNSAESIVGCEYALNHSAAMATLVSIGISL